MEFQKVYFLGIGGIGMSALARYFLHEGEKVAGYDRTPSHLTDELSAEGAAIHFEDDVRLIPAEFLDPAATMVVYTPAVPQEHGEYRYEGGWNVNALIAAGVGSIFSTFLPNFTTLLPPWWGTYGWFFGVAIGGAVYYVMALARPRAVPAAVAG